MRKANKMGALASIAEGGEFKCDIDADLIAVIGVTKEGNGGDISLKSGMWGKAGLCTWGIGIGCGHLLKYILDSTPEKQRKDTITSFLTGLEIGVAGEGTPEKIGEDARRAKVIKLLKTLERKKP